MTAFTSTQLKTLLKDILFSIDSANVCWYDGVVVYDFLQVRQLKMTSSNSNTYNTYNRIRQVRG